MPRGGKRPGAGRKKKTVEPVTNQNEPKESIKEDSKESNNFNQIVTKKIVENPQNASSSIQEGQPVQQVGGSFSFGSQSGFESKGESRSQSGMGRNDHRSGGESSGLHAERRVLEPTSVGFGGTTPNRYGLQNSQQILSERSTGGPSQHPEQHSWSTGGNTQQPNGIVQGNIPLSEQLKLLRDPVRFCQTFCASHAYVAWQRDFLRDCRVVSDDGVLNLGEWPRTVILAAVNGSGKTQILADVIRYLLSTVPGCVIPITSPIYRQLEMLENYLKSQNNKFPGWTCVEGRLTAPNGNFARWFATNTPTSVESFHGKFLVRIIEEAKALEDDLWDQTNRWQPKLTIIVSSKGLAMGRLYESLTKHRHLCSVHEVDAYQCPWIPQKWIEEQIEMHGRDSSIIRSMIFNEFSDYGYNNLISLSQIQLCFKNPPPWRNPGFRVGGIDLSSNRTDGDKTVCVVRQGNKLFEPYELPPCRTPEAIGLITNWIKREKVRMVFVDSSGHGGISNYEMLCENLAGDHTVQIVGINFGSKAINDLSFCQNRATELWFEGQKKIEKLELIFEWTDKRKSQFITEVAARDCKTLDSGKRILQSKSDMNYSPDLADATFLALCEPAYEKQNIIGLGKINVRDYMNKGSLTDRKFGVNVSGRSLGRA